VEEITTSGARIFGKQLDETSPGGTDLATLRALGADWFWETDSEHRFTRITEGFRSCTGNDPEQYLGRCRLDYLRRHAGRDANVAQHLGEVEAGRPFRDFAYFLEDRQGRSRLISISGEPLKDKAGNLVGYRGIGRDATGLLEAFGNGLGRHPGGEDTAPGGADSLAERLMAALNAIDDAFCYYDADGRMLLHNTALLDMFPGLADLLQPGVSFDVLIGEALERGLFVVDGVDNASLHERLVSQRHEGMQTRAVFQLADGRWILHRTIPTADGGSIAIHTDITKHKQHQERLEQALEDAEAAKVRLQAGIDALDEGFVIWDENDRIVAYNQAYLRHFPYLPEIKVGWTAEELLRAFANTGAITAAVGREEEWVREALAARQAETDHDVVFHTHGDRWILRRDRLTESGERVGIRKDLTDQKQKENELRAAREEAERLLDDMKRMVDSLRMGVVVLDADLKTEIVNKAYFEMWGVLPEDVPVGISARELFEKARKRGVYDVPDDQWETYVAERMETLRSADVAEQEIQRAGGGTMIYSVTGLSGGKRLVTYYDVSSLKAREAELAAANRTAEQLLHDFERTLDTVELGVVLLDRDLNASIINKAFYRLWGLGPEQAPRGISFAEIMERNRHNGIYDVADDKWEDFVAWRLDEIRNGDVEPREFARADGKTVIYAVTALSDGKRLITYFDVSGMKQREAELAEALEKSQIG
jgi:PAS domain-containing protein